LDKHAHIKAILHKLHHFSDEHVNLFYDKLNFKQIRKNGLLLKPGQVCDFVAIVMKGSLRIYHQNEDKEHTLSFFTEDSWVADHNSFVSQKPSANTIQAMEPTEVAIISLQNTHKLIEQDQRFMILGRILGELTIPQALSVHHASPQDRYNNLMQQHPDWIIRFPQKHLSSYLGITPETFSRVKRKHVFS
jgi:CRP-like cAMP-binding protein